MYKLFLPNQVMTRKRLTKKQAAAKRQEALREQAAVSKLLKARPKTDNRELAVNTIPSLTYDDARSARSLPSAPAAPKRTRKRADYSDNPDMAAREVIAQEEKDRKRTRLAPAYNKGPVMYITDDTDPTELGRKI